MMQDWAQLTVSDGHFLDEITAALRDAQIELRLVEPLQDPQRGVRTRFGVQSHEPKVIEVPRARLADAQALLHEIFDGAEAAALRESGVPAPSAADREDEQAWRAEIDRQRARSSRRVKWFIRIVLGAILVAALFAIIGNLFFK